MCSEHAELTPTTLNSAQKDGGDDGGGSEGQLLPDRLLMRILDLKRGRREFQDLLSLRRLKTLSPTSVGAANL